MDKALNYLALARKAGRAELGEEPAGAAARALHAHVILVASDASDHTWRRAKSFAAGTDQQCVRLPFTKDESFPPGSLPDSHNVEAIEPQPVPQARV